jgi:hypothetical protein
MCVEPALWMQETYSTVQASGNHRVPMSAGHNGCRKSLVYLACTARMCTTICQVGVRGLSMTKQTLRVQTAVAIYTLYTAHDPSMCPIPIRRPQHRPLDTPAYRIPSPQPGCMVEEP